MRSPEQIPSPVRRPWCGAACVLLCGAAWAAPAPAAPVTVGEGYRLLESGQSRQALRVFEEILRARPTDAAAREGLAWTYAKLGDRERAAQEADARLALLVNDDAWRARWVEIVFNLPARRTEALDAARALADARPTDLDAQLRLARLLSWTEGRLADAVRAYERARALAPGDPAARRGLAQALAWSGRQADAAALFDALIADDGSDADALSGRAEIARWNGDLAAARELLQRAVSARPEDESLRAQLQAVTADAARQAERRSHPAFDLQPGEFEAARAILDATPRSRVWVQSSFVNEPSSSRFDLAVPLEVYASPETRLRIESALRWVVLGTTRLTLGAALRQALPLGLYVDVSYRVHSPRNLPVAHELVAQAGGRPLDGPVGFLVGGRFGGEGTTIAGIRDPWQQWSAFASLNAARGAFYGYLNGALNGMTDGNLGRTVSGGAGVDVMKLVPLLPGHALSATYDFYYFGTARRSALYWAPEEYLSHSAGIAWSMRPAEGASMGAAGSVVIQGGRVDGFTASAHLGLRLGDGFTVAVRASHSRGESYSVTTVTVQLAETL